METLPIFAKLPVTEADLNPPNKSVFVSSGSCDSSQSPLIPMSLISFHHYDVSNLQVPSGGVPPLSESDIGKVFPLPPTPKLFCQELNMSPPLDTNFIKECIKRVKWIVRW